MKLNNIDLLKELEKSKNDRKPDLLSEVKAILASDRKKEKRIVNEIQGNNLLDQTIWDKLDQNFVYSIEDIKAICIKYRLRFLDSKHFKGEIPYEAIQKIKSLEKKTGTELKGFKVIAPKELFNLEDKDSDPLLFLQLNDKRFLFIHKWGGELNRFRSVLAFPLRNFMTMFWFLFILAFLFSLAITPSSPSIFAFLVVHSFIGICGLACLIIFSLRENFSNVEWDSKFLS